MVLRHCLNCNKLTKNNKYCSRLCYSTLNKPPSQKGKKRSKEAVYKTIEAKRLNGSLYHTPERTRKIQEARKRFYDAHGRKTEVGHRLKTTKKYKQWRKAIFERDNYTCQMCGERGGRLNADHIVPKSILILICNNNFEECMKFSLMWDINNGRTLCHKCHKLTPTYGKSNLYQCLFNGTN